MQRNLIFPSAYIQGNGILASPGSAYDHLRGNHAFFIGGNTALDQAQRSIERGLRDSKISIVDVNRGVNRCTPESIREQSERFADSEADIVVGVGGGAAIDVATSVGMEHCAEYVSIPTIASTDAPTSSIAVVYDEAGNYLETRKGNRNPDLVIVDTALISRAPCDYLRFGMGDAIATYFEAEIAAKVKSQVHAGGASGFAALDLARVCYNRISEYGESAIYACERDSVTPALEKVVEANILLSGIGFESGGTAGAHAIALALVNGGVEAPHGVLVAFSTVADLILQDASPATVREVMELYSTIGLYASVRELDLPERDLHDIGRDALEKGLIGQPMDPKPSMIAGALYTAETMLSDFQV